MKSTILFLAFGLISTLAFTQNFAPVGAEWYYNEQFAFSGDINYIQFTVEKDTVLEGITCQKITKRHQLTCLGRSDTEFVYSSGDTVFFYDPVFNIFQTLYVLNAQVNDSWSIKVRDENDVIDTVTVTVNTVSTININNQSLKTMDVTYDKNGDQEPMQTSSTIIEKIGDIKYMFNWWPWSGVNCDANWTSGLRCYQDAELGWYNTGIVDSCNHVYKYVDIEEFSTNSMIDIYPNPACEFVTINIAEYIEFTAEILNSNGQSLKTKSSSNSNLNFNLENMAQGVYFIQIKHQNKVIGIKKLLKE